MSDIRRQMDAQLQLYVDGVLHRQMKDIFKHGANLLPDINIDLMGKGYCLPIAINETTKEVVYVVEAPGLTNNYHGRTHIYVKSLYGWIFENGGITDETIKLCQDIAGHRFNKFLSRYMILIDRKKLLKSK